jgi:class 3 adenylate cyclase
MDIAAWLRGLGLEQYAQLFRDNDVDGGILCGMTAEDLKELGISSFGHRRRLLNAIIALGGEPPTRDVAQSATRVTTARISPPPIDAERRQLTVMFCDLVGSTPLSARLDPEDLRSIIGAYHRCVAEIVEGVGGFVARYMGDGVLVYFGYPQAHEDDAERATRCGLALVDRVAQLGQREELHARVGIATGLFVVGGEVVEHDVAGDTPNLAARLQALAEPDTVVIAANTRRLVGDLFDYRDLGAIEVKGLAAPVPGWQVLRASAIESRFEALRGSVLTPLIGRDEEIDLLLRRWARANTGDGQVVLISGEAGIGKSRLTAALAERLHAEPHIRLRCFCSPSHQDSALYPFIDQLGRASEFARDDPPASKLEKLAALLARAAPLDEDVALLADLLSLPGSEREACADGERSELIDRVAAGAPVGKLLVIEAIRHARLPLAEDRLDHRAGIELPTIDAHRAPEAAADLERGLDDGVAGEARRNRLEIRDFTGWDAAGHSVPPRRSGRAKSSTYMGRNGPACMRSAFGERRAAAAWSEAPS